MRMRFRTQWLTYNAHCEKNIHTTVNGVSEGGVVFEGVTKLWLCYGYGMLWYDMGVPVCLEAKTGTRGKRQHSLAGSHTAHQCHHYHCSHRQYHHR